MLKKVPIIIHQKKNLPSKQCFIKKTAFTIATSALYMEYRCKGTIFRREKIHDLRSGPDNCPKLR